MTTDQLTYTDTLQIIECFRCHINFAMPVDFNKQCLADRTINFYCPQGHSQHYLGKTDKQRLEEQLNRARGSEQFYRDQASRERRRVAAAKGQLTKLRNRVARGVCPQAGCKRSFTDVHDHVRSCHPDLLGLVEVSS